MPRQCVVGGCSNTNKGGFKLHQWPKDPKLARNWTKFVRNTRVWNEPTKWSHICSEHFAGECYEITPMARSCGYPPRLREDAIPTITTIKPKTQSSAIATRETALPECDDTTMFTGDWNGAGCNATGLCPPASYRTPLDVLADTAVTLPYAEEDVENMEISFSKPSKFPPRGNSNNINNSIRPAFKKGQRNRVLDEIQLSNIFVPPAARFVEYHVLRDDIGIQVCPEVKSRGVQVTVKPAKPKMVSTGIQCELLKPLQDCEESSDGGIESEDEFMGTVESMEFDDPEYIPDSDDYQDSPLDIEPVSELPHKQKVFLVYEGALLELFSHCSACHSECVSKIQRILGTCVTIYQRCTGCEFQRLWESQPHIGNTPAGNLMMSSSMLFSGSSISQTINFLQHLGVPVISYQTFLNHQTYYLQPAILSLWNKEQASVEAEIKANGGKFDAAGDGRADSPGHSAQYGSYTLLDTRLNKVAHIELVTVTEVTSSNAMEKEGLVRAVTDMEKRGIGIREITTDRHTSIRKYLREKKPKIKHSLDVWHAAKGLGKKIDKLGKQKGCDKVNEWKKSITNHLYWVAGSTPDANADVMEAKWLSITNHIQNIHRHESKLFPKCQHGRLTGRQRKKKWMIPNEVDTEKLVEILTKKALIKDSRMLSAGQQTSSLESYHAVVNHFAPKLLHFSYQGMKSRLMLSALHFNENAGRKQAVTKAGNARYRIEQPKYKKGEHTVKRILVPRTYRYVDHLKEAVYALANNRVKASRTKDDPPSMCDAYDKPDKQHAINNHKSRFNIVS